MWPGLRPEGFASTCDPSNPPWLQAFRRGELPGVTMWQAPQATLAAARANRAAERAPIVAELKAKAKIEEPEGEKRPTTRKPLNVRVARGVFQPFGKKK
jgi:hypothetical protein